MSAAKAFRGNRRFSPTPPWSNGGYVTVRILLIALTLLLRRRERCSWWGFSVSNNGSKSSTAWRSRVSAYRFRHGRLVEVAWGHLALIHWVSKGGANAHLDKGHWTGERRWNQYRQRGRERWRWRWTWTWRTAENKKRVAGLIFCRLELRCWA